MDFACVEISTGTLRYVLRTSISFVSKMYRHTAKKFATPYPAKTHLYAVSKSRPALFWRTMGRAPHRAPSAPPESRTTLYQDKVHVRCLSETRLGSAACSIANAALRSVPIPLSIAMKLMTTRPTGVLNEISATPPNEASVARRINDPRLPSTSTRKLIHAVATALPARPAAITAPIHVALKT